MFPRQSDHRLRRRPLGRYRYVRLRWRLLFAVVDWFGSLTVGMARRLRSLLARVFPGQSADAVSTILVVQLDHLGDAIISTVLFPALRKRYPDASIEVLAGPWNRELFEAVAEVDRVHVCRVNRFARRGRLGWMLSTFYWGFRLRGRRADVGIDVRGEFPHAVILWLSGARRRVGWDCGGGGFLLTDSPAFVLDRPEVESRLALLAELGIRPEGSAGAPRPRFCPPEQARRRVAGWLAERAGKRSPRGPRIVVHVGAGTPAKAWPAEHWRALVGWLVDQLRAEVVLVGGPGDRTIARTIAGRRASADVADWTGRLALVELAAALEQADLFVGADSGPAHLAAAVGTPAVVLFSGTNNPRQWQPSGEQVSIVRHPVECSPCHRRRCALPAHPCMRHLTPELVAEAVDQMYRRAVCDRVALASRQRTVGAGVSPVREASGGTGVSPVRGAEHGQDARATHERK